MPARDRDGARRAVEEGKHLAADRDLDGALRQFGRAIEADPSDPEAYVRRGLTCEQQNRCAEALADYSKAIDLAPKVWQARSARAQLHDSMGEYGKARADYSAAIRLSARSPVLYSMRAQVFGSLHDAEKAIADGDMAIELDTPKRYAVSALGIRGKVHFATDRIKEAVADLARARE